MSEHCHRVKCDCSVQRIRKNINNLTASKQATITLLDLLHRSRNKCIFIFNNASNAGMLHWTWWVMTANTRSPGQVVQSSAPKIIGHTQSLHAWPSEISPELWCIHRRTKGTKSSFLTAFEHREKEARSLFAAQYFYRSFLWMFVSSESSISSTAPAYLQWLTELTDFSFSPPHVSVMGWLCFLHS